MFVEIETIQIDRIQNGKIQNFQKKIQFKWNVSNAPQQVRDARLSANWKILRFA